MNRLEYWASLFLPWFIVTTLIYTYNYVDRLAFISINYISYFYMGVVLSILLNPNLFVDKGSTSLSKIIRNPNLSISFSVFLAVSLYSWVASDMGYMEIMFRISITLLQYTLIHYIAIFLLATIERKNIVVGCLAVIAITRLSDLAGDNYLFINFIGTFFYLPVQLYERGNIFIAFSLFAIQSIFLFLMKQLAQRKVVEYLRALT